MAMIWILLLILITVSWSTIVTALPPQYLKWLEKTEVNGFTDIFLKLKGQYIAWEYCPELTFDINIRNGYINHEKSATGCY